MDIIERDGFRFSVVFEDDHDQTPPWDDEDGHGPIRKSIYRHSDQVNKRPGERPMNRPNRHEHQFYYDWQAAMKLARTDWGFTTRKDAAKAVQQDFDRMCRWLNQDWGYIGIVVQMIDEDDNQLTGEASVWHVESDGDYKHEVANELADEVAQQYRVNHRFQLAMENGL
jgi:hypothetical protein